MRSLMRVFSAAGMVLALSLASFAQTKDQPKGAQPPKGQMPDMAAMMAAMKPGPEHQIIAKLAGDWTVTGKMWMDPSGNPMDMKPGVWHGEMVLGGRYLQSVQTGEMMGMPYEGHGLMGYDNFKKVYQMTWVDNMGTTISTASGTADAPGKVISMMGKMDEPSTGEKDKDVKYQYTFKDDKNVLFEIFDTIPGKGMVKVMEMMYTKK